MCLPHLTSLTRLALESNLIGNVGLEAIARGIADNTTLKELFLYNNDLDDDTMYALSLVFVNKFHLQTLGLEYNRIRSRGANHIFYALKSLPRFERLFFSHNLIGESSAQPIMDLLTQSESLREIRINDNTQIGDDAGL